MKQTSTFKHLRLASLPTFDEIKILKLLLGKIAWRVNEMGDMEGLQLLSYHCQMFGWSVVQKVWLLQDEVLFDFDKYHGYKIAEISVLSYRISDFVTFWGNKLC